MRIAIPVLAAIVASGLLSLRDARADHPCLGVSLDFDNQTFGAQWDIKNRCTDRNFKIEVTCSDGESDTRTVLRCDNVKMVCGHRQLVQFQPIEYTVAPSGRASCA